MNTHLKKNMFWNMVGTTLNAFNSLFFMVVVTRINGPDDGGVFTLSFSLACLFFTVGVYAGRTYQVTDHGEFTDKEYLFHRFVCVIIMVFVAIIYVIFKGYDQYKLLVILLLTLFKALEAFTDTIYGILQKIID